MLLWHAVELHAHPAWHSFRACESPWQDGRRRSRRRDRALGGGRALRVHAHGPGDRRGRPAAAEGESRQGGGERARGGLRVDADALRRAHGRRGAVGVAVGRASRCAVELQPRQRGPAPRGSRRPWRRGGAAAGERRGGGGAERPGLVAPHVERHRRSQQGCQLVARACRRCHRAGCNWAHGVHVGRAPRPPLRAPSTAGRGPGPQHTRLRGPERGRPRGCVRELEAVVGAARSHKLPILLIILRLGPSRAEPGRLSGSDAGPRSEATRRGRRRGADARGAHPRGRARDGAAVEGGPGSGLVEGHGGSARRSVRFGQGRCSAQRPHSAHVGGSAQGSCRGYEARSCSGSARDAGRHGVDRPASRRICRQPRDGLRAPVSGRQLRR
mmetsp:Transcript_91451/g.295917  ORF Transcript_91451/g.295917 Transcript_91451/m.295917 type:complete len:385 (-) Transcript_91451:899-2053(-)